MEEIIEYLYGDYKDYEGTSVTKTLLIENENFRNLIINGIKEHKISGFDEKDWNLIRTQNIRCIDNFETVFKKGLNIGCCTSTSKQLSYSFNDAELISGIMDFLIGTRNAPNGEHSWMENDNYIYDTTLLLKIDKSLAKNFGYHEEVRLDQFMLRRNGSYAAAKEFTTDTNLKAR